MASFNRVSSIILFILFFINRSFANICDFCDCQPSRNDVFSVTCGCESIKNLRFTSDLMVGVESVSMVVIKNCHTVNIGQNSFSRLEKLDTLAIQNSLYVSLAAGAFSSLNSLLINNVRDISFSEMALMGARGIKNIIINSSNITQLPTYSLYDLEGVERLTFGNVSIGQINRGAVNVSAKSIVMQNVKINHIETNGLSLEAQKVLIKNSIFKNPAVGSINIISEFQTRFLNNEFGGIFQANVTSPFVEFSGNRFENFHSGVFENAQMSRVMNNSFTRMNFYGFFKVFDYKDFYDNYFECNCGMNLFDSSRKYDNYDIFKKNFCKTNCSLNLFEFEVESTAKCMKDGKVDAISFCNYERTVRNNKRFRNLNHDSPKNETKDLSVNKIESRFLIGVDEEVDVNSTSSTSKAFSVKMCSSLFMFALVILSIVHY
ncbi:hypothetical protein ILUMI_23793 [Ignelater luminosus]|uniref:Uncharacterized protein n=1 Tax=Ignelater luminosus TaxID=2038154 RepID=A0A8K0G1J2_IGNLU|nr:hypothetical protein ILUMI_23793 [Ignelater luminosus]